MNVLGLLNLGDLSGWGQAAALIVGGAVVWLAGRSRGDDERPSPDSPGE